jgi:hypothetical protein
VNGRTPHGTSAGARWHRRYKIPACEPCREAEAAGAAVRRDLRRLIGLIAGECRRAGMLP